MVGLEMNIGYLFRQLSSHGLNAARDDALISDTQLMIILMLAIIIYLTCQVSDLL